MNVYEIKSEKEWQEILDRLYEQTGMPAALMDAKNVILQSSGDRNELCSAIRGEQKSKSFICGQSQQYLAEQAWSAGKPVMEECEAGLFKIVLPLLLGDERLGTLTACGSLASGGEIEDFLIQQNIDLDNETLASFKAKIPGIDPDALNGLIQDLFEKIRQ